MRPSAARPDSSSLLKPSEANIFEGDEIGEELLLNEDEWFDMLLEVVLDSGSADHVCDDRDALGYVVRGPDGSRRDQHLTMGHWTRIPDRGEMPLNLEADTGDGVANKIQRRPSYDPNGLLQGEAWCAFW